MDGLIDGWFWTDTTTLSITGSRWYRAQLRGAQFGTPNRAPAPRGPDKLIQIDIPLNVAEKPSYVSYHLRKPVSGLR